MSALEATVSAISSPSTSAGVAHNDAGAAIPAPRAPAPAPPPAASVPAPAPPPPPAEAAGPEATPARGEISVLTLVGEMADLEHLARLPAAPFTAGMTASTDRRSRRP